MRAAANVFTLASHGGYPSCLANVNSSRGSPTRIARPCAYCVAPWLGITSPAPGPRRGRSGRCPGIASSTVSHASERCLTVHQEPSPTHTKPNWSYTLHRPTRLTELSLFHRDPTRTPFSWNLLVPATLLCTLLPRDHSNRYQDARISSSRVDSPAAGRVPECKSADCVPDGGARRLAGIQGGRRLAFSTSRHRCVD